MREIVKEHCGMSENKAKETQVYTGIDVFKLIAAVLVVLLHTVETSNYYACAMKEVFTRLAVPFFFIASGFFPDAPSGSRRGLRETFLCQRFQLLSRFLDQFPVFFPVLPGHFHDLAVFSRHIAIIFPHMGKEAVRAVFDAFFREAEVSAAGVSQGVKGQ